MAGITLIIEGKVETAVFTDPETVEIDETQYSTGQGPCLDAFEHDRVNRIDSTQKDTRWVEFASAALAHGIESTLSLPIVARDVAIGALNLYARRSHAFDAASEVRLGNFARQSAIVLSNAHVYWDARTLSENLTQALDSRSTIDQATGILMAHSGGTSKEAFQILVAASQRENRKLREIASEIVERVSQRGLLAE
jgi:GAF domain-containing protein